MLPETSTQRQKNLGVLLRVGIFALIAILGNYFIFPIIIAFFGVPILVVATLGTFAAAAVANSIVLRIYERGQLADIGLEWTAASRRNLAVGVLGGLGAALVVLVLPLLVRIAYLVPVPNEHFQWPAALFVSIVLLFGAVGEEMLFRGYMFQVLVKAIGPFATILPMSVLFGLAHSDNLNFTWLALLNTVLWGVVLGYAFLLSGDLWLPIGLHFGWNWTLPWFGANLSGFTMGVTGYSMHWKVGELWSGGAYGPEGGLLTSVTVVAVFFYLQRAPIQYQEAFLLREAS
ncbi:MAG TPA: CPBP family intramembrane glutamic endopeptidase [Bryobacteraceae bacterium]|nr:CPBP family intramembrane glutamic endopeptidase [Bryobacteraceae bacterium]